LERFRIAGGSQGNPRKTTTASNRQDHAANDNGSTPLFAGPVAGMPEAESPFPRTIGYRQPGTPAVAVC